jgi:hypothetical protein
MALECDWVLCMKTFTTPALQLHGNNYCSRNCWEKGLLRERWLSTCDEADELRAQLEDKRAFLEASRLQVEAIAMKADIERTRMQLEDVHSRQMRER